MANGKPNFELVEQPALDRFFAPIARTLQDFAARHRLQLSKYDKQNTSWDFLFRHPAGGVARIQVLPVNDGAVSLFVHWHVCDFAAFRRSILSLDRGTIHRDDPRLADLLDAALAELLAMGLDGLVPDGVDWRQYWRADVMKDIQAAERALPLPIP